MTVDGVDHIAYVIDTSEEEDYTFDEETEFDVYTVDVRHFHVFLTIVDTSLWAEQKCTVIWS